MKNKLVILFKSFFLAQRNTQILFALVLASLFVNFWGLELRHNFDFDQEMQAKQVYEDVYLAKHPTLAGSQFSALPGIAFPPYYFYILLPFLVIFKGDPLGGALLAGFVGVLTTAMAYILGRKIQDHKTGLFAGLITLLHPITTSWSPMFLPLWTMMLLYFLLDINKNSNRKIFVIIGGLLGVGFSFHPAMAFLLISTILYYLYQKISIRKIFFTIFVCIFFVSPSLIFMIRHGFNIHILSSGFSSFIVDDQGKSALISLIFPNSLVIFWRAIKVQSYLPYFDTLVTGLIYIAGVIFALFRMKNKSWQMLFIFFVTVPILIFWFYPGVVSEYYFLTALTVCDLLFGLILGKIFFKSRFATIVFGTFLFFAFYKALPLSERYANYYSQADKKEIVGQISTLSQGQKTNLWLNFPLGENYGYLYLLRRKNVQIDLNLERPKLIIVKSSHTEKVDGVLVFKNSKYLIYKVE